MIRLVDLKSSFDRLDEPEKDSKGQNEHSYPERIPLHAIPAIMPPLGKCARGRLIIGLLQNHQPVPPEFEVLNLALTCVQITTPSKSFVHKVAALLVFLVKLLQPYRFASLSTSCPGELRLGEEEG